MRHWGQGSWEMDARRHPCGPADGQQAWLCSPRGRSPLCTCQHPPHHMVTLRGSPPERLCGPAEQSNSAESNGSMLRHVTLPGGQSSRRLELPCASPWTLLCWASVCLCHPRLVCSWLRGRGERRKEKKKKKSSTYYKNKQGCIMRENETCAWILRIISKTSKNFLIAASFCLCPKCPKWLLYSLEILWIKSSKCADFTHLIISLLFLW